MKKILKKLTCLILALCVVFGTMGAVTLASERKYTAHAYINDTRVGFENAPYMQGSEIFVPLKEACQYMNISLSEENGTYTLSHGNHTVTLQEGNMIIYKNGQSVDLSFQTWNNGGVLYAPTELFSAGLEIDLTLDKEARRVFFRPNIYKVYITENNAAMVSLKEPDKDILHTGATATDDIIYNENLLTTVELSLYYKFDLGDFAGKTITDATLTAHCGMYGNLNPRLGAIRTYQWDKGSITYNTAPAHYKDASIKQDPTYLTTATHGRKKYYLPHTITMTDWAKESLSAGEPLAIKLLGIPQVKSNNTPQVMVKGVNTPEKAYLSVTVDEEFNFPVAKEERQTDIDRNTFTKLAFLTKLGVFKEGEEFPADLTTGVTRREFVAYAIRLMNDFDYNEDAAQIFADVEPKSASYGCIMDSAALGLISSGEGMAFRPDDIITYDEALTIIGRMLGYGTYADKNGGFSQGFVSAAVKNDLLDGVRSHSGKMGFDSIFNLFFNALEAPMFDAHIYSSNGNLEYIFDPDITLLSTYWELERIEGTLEGNEYTNLNPDISGKSGKLIIDGKEYTIDNPEYNSLLGYEVHGYCDKYNNILYLGADKVKNNTEVIDLHSVTLVNAPSGSSLTYSYEKKNGSITTESISSIQNIIYNGKSIKFSQLKKSLLEKDTGSITYLNDTTVIINAYTTVVVYNVDEEEEVITDKYAPYDNTLRLKDTDYYVFRDENGSSIELENLAVNDVISAAVSLDKKVVTGEISKTKLTGKITSITDEKDIEVNGHIYETVGTNLSWISDIEKLGTEGTLLLDVFGYVAGFDAARPTENLKGYVLLSGTSGNGINPKLQLGLITTDSEDMVAYNLAKKVVIDGVSCKTHDEIRTALGKGESDSDVKKQGIIFSVNTDGEITKIDTPYFNQTKELAETSLHLRYNESTQLHYKSGAGRLGDYFYWDRATALNVMFTGDEEKIEQVNDTEYYQYFRSGLENDKKCTVEVYSVGKKHPNADIVLVKATPSTSVGGTIAIAGKQVYTINEDGYYDRKLYYYVASATASSAIISDDFSTVASDASKAALAALKPGDIIRVGKDFNGKLTAITRYYAYDKENPQILSNPHYTDSYNDEQRIYGGYVTSKYDSYVRFIDDIANIDTEEEYEAAGDSNFRWIDLNMNGNYKSVFKYEVNGNDVIVEKATVDDVVDFDHVPYAPSGIMLQTKYAQTINAAYVINVKQPENTGIYKVTFEPGENAAGTKDLIRANIGDSVTLPTSEGFLHNDPAYAFDCWTYNGQDYIEGALITVTGDMTFTAKWKWVGVQYDVTYNGNGAGSGTVSAARAIGGSTYTVAQNPAETGFKKALHRFAGWKASNDGAIYQPGDSFAMPEEAVTFTAQWTPLTEEPTLSSGVYQITKAEELAWFANHVNSGNTAANAKIMNEIDMKDFGNWYDFRIKGFKGTLDGNNQTIKNFYVADSGSTDQGGLFRSINGGTLKNLVFKAAKAVSNYTANATSPTYTSIVCGELADGTIDNVRVSGEITTGTGAYANTAGSIVAHMTKGKVQNCISDVNITLANGSNTYATAASERGIGGIVGLLNSSSTNNTGTIEQCGFEGSINAPNSTRVGGVVGNINSNYGYIKKCYNTGNITAKQQVAGVIGWRNDGTNISQTYAAQYIYNTGNITATSAENTYAAGVVNGARNTWLKYYCYSTGDVTVDDGDDTTPEFNTKCALVATATSGTAGQNSVKMCYVPRTYGDNASKAPFAVGGTAHSTGTNIKAYTEAQFKDGTALSTLGTSVFKADTNNINNGFPIFTWQ